MTMKQLSAFLVRNLLLGLSLLCICGFTVLFSFQPLSTSRPHDTNFLSRGTAKLRAYELSPDAGLVTVAAAGKTLLSGISYQDASNYLVIPAGGYAFDVSSPTNNATLSTSATLNANMVASLFVVGMFNGSPKSELVTSH